MKLLKTSVFNILMFAMIFVVLAPKAIAQSKAKSSNEISYATTATNKDLNWLPAPDFFPGCSFTILHGDIAKPNLDFFFKVEPNTEVISHTHHSPERMVLVSGNLEVQYKGEDPLVLEEGTYAYGPAGKPHRAKCLDNGPCVLFIAMIDPFDAKPIAKKD